MRLRHADQPAYLQMFLTEVVAECRAVTTKVHDAAALQDKHPAVHVIREADLGQADRCMVRVCSPIGVQ